MVAHVVLPQGGDKHYTYSVPGKLRDKICLHGRVCVEFGSEKKIALVTAITVNPPERDIASGLKPVLRLIDSAPIVNSEQIELAKKVSAQTLSSLGEALFAMIPAGRRDGEVQEFYSESSSDSFTLPPLTSPQAEVYRKIKDSDSKSKTQVHLLHGVTGAGKTRVYLELIRDYLNAGESVIMLVPEIALSYHFLAGMKPLFQEQMAILHSGLSRSFRLSEYKRVLKGEARLVVGTRSAVFAPVRNPSLIILDEEHDASYKQAVSPRYEARKVAFTRLGLHGDASGMKKILLLGSATPSVESWHFALEKKFVLHSLKERATGQSLPEIKLIHYDSFLSDRPALSEVLREKTREHLARGNQVLFLMNRRGHSHYAFCPTCEESAKCPSCSISLTIHRDKNGRIMKCHFCAHEEPLRTQCPKCKTRYRFTGRGTQKLEDEIEKQFPGFEYARVDQDNARGKGYVEDVLEAVKQNKIQILLGTQMLAKGFDLPKVTLVGILGADAGLMLPDFRASERVFQLILQAAGRSGRHEKGEVYIQTAQPGHYAVTTAQHYDYEEFARQELSFRKELHYPPFSRLCRILIRGELEKQVIGFCDYLARLYQENISGGDLFSDPSPSVDTQVLGPMPAPVERIQKEYRYHFILRSTQEAELHKTAALFKSLLPSCHKHHPGVKVDIDMAPVQMM